MGDWPVRIFPPLPVVTPWGVDSYGVTMNTIATGSLFAAASQTATANLASYFPFRIWTPATAVKMGILIGSATTGNVDCGIYDSQKNRLVNSGSTALGSANTLLELNITDTPLKPGIYYMAIQFSSGSGTGFGQTQGDEFSVSQMGLFTEAVGSFGLPATANWSTTTVAAPIFWAMGVWFDTLL